MQSHRQSTIESVLRHLAHDGIFALIFAVAALIQLRGLTFGIVMVFGVPPLWAALMTRATRTPKIRWAAWGFLGAIGLGAIVAQVPWLFPNLSGANRELGRFHDRLLTWYGAVYLIWLIGVLPLFMFIGSLRAHQEGKPAQISQVTCYLGLATFGLLWINFPLILWLLGFWPVF